jgi:hypothetical protein
LDQTKVDRHNTLVDVYLQNRGLILDVLERYLDKDVLFFHPKLKYYHEILDDFDIVIDKEYGEYPAMIAKVFDIDFTTIGFHKTYLNEEGKKAPVECPKKLSSAVNQGDYSKNGSIVPLCKVSNGRYGIAEGIETSLAILSMGRPCWSVLNANGIMTFPIPEDCHTLDIYGDLDASKTGQNVLAEKYFALQISHPNLKVNLYLPPELYWDKNLTPKGIDFLDLYKIKPNALPALKF